MFHLQKLFKITSFFTITVIKEDKERQSSGVLGIILRGTSKSVNVHSR